jgi:hypothetical protein
MNLTDRGIDLLEKMYYQGDISVKQSKRCLLISIDLLIENTPSVNIYPPNFQQITPKVKEYWVKVKQKIEVL